MAQDWDPKGNYNPYAAPVAMIAPPPRVEDADLRLLGARSTRFVARLIDNVLFVLSAMPGFFGVMIGHGKLELPAYAGVLVAWAFIAYQCYLVTTTGQSVAKRWMGLKVVRSDGSRAGFVHGVLIREWLVFVVGFIPAVGMLFRLVDSVMIFGEDRRCLHDHFSDTKVIVAQQTL